MSELDASVPAHSPGRENGSLEKNILYDLLLTVEWPEITSILNTERGLSYLWRRIASSVHAFLRVSLDRIRHPIRYLSSFSSPSVIVRLLNAKLPWKLAITSDGLLLAVLKDDVIEIRSILGDFERVNTTIPVGRDVCAQWRQLLWSEDGYVLAMATSCGEVHLFSPSGKYLGQVGHVSVEESDYEGALTQAVAAMVFIPPQKDRHDQGVLSLLNVLFYDGTLETYEIRANSEPVHAHSFSFGSYFPEGLSAMTYVAKHNLLLVGGSPYSSGERMACGISGWRLLDAPPYWGPRLGQQIEKIGAGGLSRLYFKRKESRNLKGTVFSMCLSPSSSLLAVIDLAGSLALWEVPSLRHKATFDLNQLPGRQARTRRQGHPVPLEVSWWNEEALVVVKEAGEVIVLSTSTLKDLLGNAPLSGWSITPTYNQQFFLLQCNMSQRGVVRRFRVPSLSRDVDGGEDEEEEDQDEPGFSLSRFSSDLVKQVLYFVTDSERFRPHSKKKLKYQAVTRKYSLACMKAITPAECYERKLVRGEYAEALELAREYELDSDQVHQRQWHSYQVSVSTIQDYLAEVSKLWWVLQECLGRSTSDFATTRYLLRYGLSRTSFR